MFFSFSNKETPWCASFRHGMTTKMICGGRKKKLKNFEKVTK